ncbi:MAG: hypothetical protein NTV20_01615 [Candidatus Shapirobacteria bacterium]|nr:hypothetical protein [Candidatus Shapirobacteria bacterium]
MEKITAAKIKRRRNFLPALILTLAFWGILGWLVFSFPPANNLLIIVFYLLLFLATFLTSSLVFANSKLGAIMAAWAILFLVFRYFKIGNILNLSLLTAIFFLLGIYLFKSHH